MDRSLRDCPEYRTVYIPMHRGGCEVFQDSCDVTPKARCGWIKTIASELVRLNIQNNV